jgi:hypothetical protein
MRAASFLIVAMFLHASGAVRAQSVDLLRQGVVKVVATGGPNRAAAAGFIVRAEQRTVFVVTASHVVEGAERIGVEFFGEQRLYPARVLGMEGGDPQGLAVLVVEDEVPANPVVLKINRDLDVRPGEPVTMIGFPVAVGAPWAVTKGGIVGRRGRSIVFDGAVDAGNSGGPLIKEDQVVGLVTQAQGQFGYATPSAIVQYALESWGVRFAIALRTTPVVMPERGLLPLFREKGFNHASSGVRAFFGSSERPVMESLVGRFTHEFESRMVAGVRVIADRATGLMWLGEAINIQNEKISRDEKLLVAIAGANGQRLAGFADWRAPTIEELASLLERQATVRASGPQRLIDAVFGYALCASADRVITKGFGAEVLGVDFEDGNLFFGIPPEHVEVGGCAVRTMRADDAGGPSPPSPGPAQ